MKNGNEEDEKTITSFITIIDTSMWQTLSDIFRSTVEYYKIK